MQKDCISREQSGVYSSYNRARGGTKTEGEDEVRAEQGRTSSIAVCILCIAMRLYELERSEAAYRAHSPLYFAEQ